MKSISSFLLLSASIFAKTHKCSDGFEIPVSYVNDDYCDCEDGSDEKLTSACRNSTFLCKKNPDSLILKARDVHDGVCDCCDGSDELGPCQNTCLKVLERIKKENEKIQRGYEKRIALVQESLEMYSHLVSRKVELGVRLEKQELELSELMEQRNLMQEEEEGKPAKLEVIKDYVEHLENELLILADKGCSAAEDAERDSTASSAWEATATPQRPNLDSEFPQYPCQDHYSSFSECLYETFEHIWYVWKGWLGFQKMKDTVFGKGNTGINQKINKLSADISDIRSEIASIAENTEGSYGVNNEWFLMSKKCFEYQTGSFVYKICPFANATQTSNGNSIDIGKFASFDGKVMTFEGGTKCWNGPQRSLKVEFYCGDGITNIAEPETCTYTGKMGTWFMCELGIGNYILIRC
jgi:protein kinase C substrate 80K-H